MSNNLIYGINPLVISKVTAKSGKRYGRHPSWTKVMRARNPIRGIFGFYNPDFFDGWHSAHVSVYGADGGYLKSFRCDSNEIAIELKKEIEQHVSDTIEKISCDKRCLQ